MGSTSYQYVFLGLSITSSWGNGHATTYRALIRHLSSQGHRVTFLERDLPFYRANRDLPQPPYCSTALYGSLEELRDEYSETVRNADLVIVGSYVPEGVAVIRWMLATARGGCAFYDIDTPITLAQLDTGKLDYLRPELVSRFDLYLSFAGGRALQRLQSDYGARCARPLYCSVDVDLYHPIDRAPEWDLGYLGTYSDDRQPSVDALLLDPARTLRDQRFLVAGPQYPATVLWPSNVARIEHLSPDRHAEFYGTQRFTLNVTRARMIAAGHSPSVRLFEAAACATPIISDAWRGIDAFFLPGHELLLARSTEEVLRYLTDLPDRERVRLGRRARARVLSEHTAAHRAETLVAYTRDLLEHKKRQYLTAAPPTAPSGLGTSGAAA